MILGDSVGDVTDLTAAGRIAGARFQPIERDWLWMTT
jgi:hypothetical protein